MFERRDDEHRLAIDRAIAVAQRELARLEEAAALSDVELAVSARMLARSALQSAQRILGEEVDGDSNHAAQLAMIRARVVHWFDDGALPLGAASDREEALSAILRILRRAIPLFTDALKLCPELANNAGLDRDGRAARAHSFRSAR